MRFRTAFSSAMVAAIACGCKSGPVEHLVDAGTPTLQPGWTMFTDPESGVSLAIAPGWREGTGMEANPAMAGMGGDSSSNVDPNSQAGQMAAVLGKMASQMGENADKTERARLRGNGVVIQVIDGSRPIVAEARTRYFVKMIKHDSPISLETATAEEKTKIKGAGEGTEMTLPVGKAHRYESNLTLTDGDTQTQISYVLADGNNSYIIRFIETNNPGLFKNIDAEVAKSFRVKHTTPPAS